MTQQITLSQSQSKVAGEVFDFLSGRSEHAVATLSGYAGVGKTTVVAHVVRALVRRGVRVLVCAPTHKAVAVLEEKMGGDSMVKAATLQSVLAMTVRRLKGGTEVLVDSGKDGSLRSFDAAVVDEASMVGPLMFESALNKRGRCRLLFVGDPAQLDPVQDNEITAAPSPVFDQRRVRLQWSLTEVMRQALDNPIIRLATAARECIRGGERFTLEAVEQRLRPGDEYSLVICRGSDVDQIADKVAEAREAGFDSKALAYRNATVDGINWRAHRRMHGQDAPAFLPGNVLVAHDRNKAVLVSRGRVLEEVEIPNATLLTVQSAQPGMRPDDETGRPAWLLTMSMDDGRMVQAWVPHDMGAFDRDVQRLYGEYRRLMAIAKALEQGTPEDRKHVGAARAAADAADDAAKRLRDRYAMLHHTYAMTVHKSQGSTFDAVLVHWNDIQRARTPQESNKLAYVALTRTREYAMVFA